jgi:hypothetical protein
MVYDLNNIIWGVGQKDMIGVSWGDLWLFVLLSCVVYFLLFFDLFFELQYGIQLLIHPFDTLIIELIFNFPFVFESVSFFL